MELESWPEYKYDLHVDAQGERLAGHPIYLITFLVRWWDYDGNFQVQDFTVKMEISPKEGEMLEVRKLDHYPLNFAGQDFKRMVETRGHMFWKCRVRRYVQYTGPGANYLGSTVS